MTRPNPRGSAAMTVSMVIGPGFFFWVSTSLDQSLGVQKRHIGIGDQNQVRFAAQAGFGLLDGVSGAQRRVLDNTAGCIPEDSR